MSTFTMKQTVKAFFLVLSFPVFLCVDLSPEAPLGVGFVREAEAIVGRPFTPFSVAGVARRTTRRVVAVDATTAAAAAAPTTAVVAAPPPPSSSGALPIGTTVSMLPAGCVATPINGVEYFNCGAGVYYRAAFQGNNLVYVVTQP